MRGELVEVEDLLLMSMSWGSLHTALDSLKPPLDIEGAER